MLLQDARLGLERPLAAAAQGDRAWAVALLAATGNLWALAVAVALQPALAELAWHQEPVAQVVAQRAVVAARGLPCPEPLAFHAWVGARALDPDEHLTHALACEHPSRRGQGAHLNHAWIPRVQPQDYALTTLRLPYQWMVVGLRQRVVRCRCTRVAARTASWRH